MCHCKRSSPQLLIRIDFQQQVLDDDIAMQSVESPPPVESPQLDDDELSMNSHAEGIEEHFRELEEWGKWYADLSSEERDRVDQDIMRERENDNYDPELFSYLEELDEEELERELMKDEWHRQLVMEREAEESEETATSDSHNELVSSEGAVHATCKREIQELLVDDTDAMQPVSKKARRSPD